MLILGYLCMAVAVGWLGYKSYLAFQSFGGTIPMPVYDAAIYPPLIGTFGLFCVLREYSIHWPFWGFLLVALGLAGIFAGVIRVFEELGDRPLA